MTNDRHYIEHLEFSLRAYARYRWGDDSLIRKGIEIARDAHAGQVRDGGEPFLVHPLRVATHFLVIAARASQEQVVVALLHDVLEDAPAWTRGRLEEMFGSEIAAAVDCLSKTTGEKHLSAEQYKEAIINAPQYVRLIKLCDRLDNILSLRTCPDVDKRRRYLERTLTYYEAIAAGVDERLLRVIAEEIELQRDREPAAVEKSVDKSPDLVDTSCHSNEKRSRNAPEMRVSSGRRANVRRTR